ncbi:MAG: D-2-hydroxyacid dehydrogenase [Firmicutes bacterium]|nr:D-2-hydroxyacid dehydrogenase [Bacillota bacterium]
MKLLVTWDILEGPDLEQIKVETGAELLFAGSKEEELRWADQAEVIFGPASADLLRRARKCRWLQIPFAGAERVLAAGWGNPKMILTNSSGVFGPPIGEHVVGLILAFNRGLHLARDAQNEAVWQQDFPYPYRELTGSTVGILGYGDLGSQIAKRLGGFGCRIIGFRRQVRGNEPYANRIYALDILEDFLGQMDYLVAALPETEKTIGFLNEKRMRRLPSNSIIINVGRGSLIPEKDLVSALKKGWIAGAALDVTDPEPLPPSSPLWRMSNVIITPHNSGLTPFYKKRALEIFFENWRHFREKGVPGRNVVDPAQGY